LDRLKLGDVVSIDDGKLRGSIFAQADGGFAVNVTEGRNKGVKIKPGRGLNFPAVDLNLDPLTEKDRRDLDFVARHADLVGFSFVQNGDQVAELQKELAARRPDWRRLGMVAKIETPAAVFNLPEIIVQAAGHQPLAVMIARGDLSVEMGFERVAEMQEEILWLCEAAQVPAIWATQVLDGLIQEGLASRSEMTDAAMAVQAECVMLNKGPNLSAGVDALDRLLRRMGENQVKKTPTLRALLSWPEKKHR
jgi:pyruvate kinase